LPPLSPPSRPSATAAAFFFIFAMQGISHIPAWSQSLNFGPRSWLRPDLR
jgi:hypothetical protein